MRTKLVTIISTALISLSFTSTAFAANDGYDREAFGKPWVDVDQNGCDTRNDILMRDLQDKDLSPAPGIQSDGTGQGVKSCPNQTVYAGTLHDPYSGTIIEFKRHRDSSNYTKDILYVDIDHIVPLRYAWDHGAKSWDELKRVAFANDPENLIAVTNQLNQQKSAKGPSEWLPPSSVYICEYVQKFEYIVTKYQLDINRADKRKIAEIKDECKTIAKLTNDAPGAVAKDEASVTSTPEYEQFVQPNEDVKDSSNENQRRDSIILDITITLIVIILIALIALFIPRLYEIISKHQQAKG